MKRILVTGAGGSPSANFIRSLRAANEEYCIIGTDADKYYLQRAEVDRRYLAPLANDPKYIDFLNYIIEKEEVEFVHAQNDVEVSFLSENREKIKAKTFFPAKETVKILQDKFESFKLWEKAGIKVPKTQLITRDTDLGILLDEMGGSMWLRAISGAGGRGSLPVYDVKSAKNWLDFQEKNGSWNGNFTASELLEPETVTWMSLWKDGELVVAQGRKRLYWELAKISPSGVTGATGTGLTYSSEELDDIARRAVLAVDDKPDGLFGVDMAYDKNGVPNPTEINIGRFFTTHEFFTQAGLNMPEMFVKLGYNESVPVLEKNTNPLPDGLVWIRGMDFLPVLSDINTVDAAVAERDSILEKL
ncbi:ATP-grasp domain-containing protein [Candidatus Southlakia epibionticum]|uniref:Carboxylate--amine ligase n=1 Tax=Candidatus Southlakia epibionticum TaxID=3043284 RepID=A0ABY8WX34_9BACT|nr:Carboxylate--amine ligase [Candidatus Saccharimonadaceae bacterium ML1]